MDHAEIVPSQLWKVGDKCPYCGKPLPPKKPPPGDSKIIPAHFPVREEPPPPKKP